MKASSGTLWLSGMKASRKRFDAELRRQQKTGFGKSLGNGVDPLVAEFI